MLKGKGMRLRVKFYKPIVIFSVFRKLKGNFGTPNISEAFAPDI
jgi:hypothetical protein